MACARWFRSLAGLDALAGFQPPADVPYARQGE
jgi:hypothetical protein